MTHEAEIIAQAIEGLRQESDIVKDYMFPLASGLFSSLLGGGVAYFTLRYHENIQIEKEKMDAANKWMLIVENAFSSLISIKSNYHGKLEVNPMQRASTIPALILNAKPIIEDLTKLSFILPKKEDKYSYNIKWRGIPRIRGMINNYNHILDVWEKRNEIDRPIKEKILHDYTDQGFVNVTTEQVFKSVSKASFISLIDLTEKAIKLTDDLIIELHDFLLEFPDAAKPLIKTEKLKRYGSLFTFSSKENPILLGMLVKSTEVSYELLSQLYGKTIDQIKEDYRTGYEEQ